ncbi:MAG: hypothetical protein CSA38_01050 [Flavobacteriales bacterium]|nr:MAG: hypothetical protein CSA38_01050 [Flavobacteriales bacterium]
MTEANHHAPLKDSLTIEEMNTEAFSQTVQNTMKKNVYAGEMTKSVASIPSTSSAELNAKVVLLENQMRAYLEASGDKSLEQKTFEKIKLTYKNIQGLVKKITEQEREQLKVPLVKIKTNITKLEALESENP